MGYELVISVKCIKVSAILKVSDLQAMVESQSVLTENWSVIIKSHWRKFFAAGIFLKSLMCLLVISASPNLHNDVNSFILTMKSYV